MAPHSAAASIEYTNNVWRVCVAGMCKEHQQEWQARVFYHQMINNPTAREVCQCECQGE